VSKRTGFPIGNVFHAGDGNLHPAILYDEREPDQMRRAVAAGEEILRVCVGLGGSLTGEHGIGIGKRALLSELFGPDDLQAMERVRAAFDPFGRLNPGKVLPTPSGCGEGRVGARRPAGC